MAMMTGGSSGGSRFGRGRYRPTAEINITPFVDVMLVLLIIFMVAAPLLTVTVPVDLSPSAATGVQMQEEKPLAVTVASDGRVFIADQEVALDQLVAQIRATAHGNQEQRIYVRGDRTVNYDRVMQVMSLINDAGFHRIGLMATPVKR
jgi:biopolymer transport protein TolR